MKILKKISLLSFLLFSSSLFAQSTPVSALSFNLHCFEDEWQNRLNIVAKEIAALSPTVLAFQEVCTDQKANMIDYLKQKLLSEGYPLKETTFIFTHKSWDIYNEHIVIMSKEKTEETTKGFLPKSPLQRAYIGQKINGVYFVNTHLEHLSAQYRKEELAFLIKQFSGKPHIILGDLNSNSNDPEQAPLLQAGYTPHFTGPTYPSSEPFATYDGFWTSPLVKSYTDSIVRRVFLFPYNNLYLSDHVGVLFELQK